jgi:hypothetical protein
MIAVAACATAASATTFYVNQRNGEDSHDCESGSPCLTIGRAITAAEGKTGPNTIEVAEGEYTGTINLNKPADKGLTINGEEDEYVKFTGAVSVALSGAVTLSNMQVVHETGAGAAISDDGAALTLENMLVDNESGTDGVAAKGSGSVTIDGGTLEMEDGAAGYAVGAEDVPLTLSGVTILNGAESPDEAGGINSRESSLSLSNTNVIVAGSASMLSFGITTEHDSSVSMQTVTVQQNSDAPGVILEQSPATVNGLTVEMRELANIEPAVLSELEGAGASSVFSHLTTEGVWGGVGLAAVGGEVTLSDSHVSGGRLSPAVDYTGGSGRGLLVQRSVLQGAPKAEPGTLRVLAGNATLDSSEVLGGKDGVFFENSTGGVQTLTVAGSTIGSNFGVFVEPPGVVGVEAVAKGGHSSTADVAIEGSIVREAQVASTANSGNTSSVACTYSSVPSEIQTANTLAGHGAIACASETSGNTNASAEAVPLFSELSKNYNLNPASSAVDSVPASAIALPFGLTASATDLIGNPRVVDGNGDCVAVQDKGALELQGHSAACPVSPTSPAPGPTPVPLPLIPAPRPPAPAISGLTISPSAFLAALSGPTIYTPKGKTKKKYGTKIAYRDSQAATLTFTVLRESSGRKQGKSCEKPSGKNKHGKRCTLLTKLGGFTHVDKAGANSVRFSGRLKGKKLQPGIYELQAIAHGAGGFSHKVTKTFTIK